MDGSTVLILSIVALGVLITLVIIVGLRRGPGAWYTRQDALSPADGSALLERIEATVGDHYRVFPHIRVAEFAATKPHLSRRNRNWAINRILDLRLDFALFPRDGSPASGVLIGDDGDLPRRQRRRRAFLRQVCDAVDLPLATLDPALTGDPDYLRNALGQSSTSPAPDQPARQEPTLG